ncbi:MAG: cobaltochelatase subunit CobN [Rhizobiales bacterium]|nr:cobaltochelatase subunit CobN [Hyphomicrobiales bacterium]
MHLLATQTGQIDGGAEAVDLGQSPGDIVILSAADSELASLARAYDALTDPKPRLRLVNILQLQHNLSIDLYLEKTLRHAKLIILRLLGGAGYWTYGLNELVVCARDNKIALAVLPGDQRPDPELTAHSNLPPSVCERLQRYLTAGGPDNAQSFLDYCRFLIAGGAIPAEPRSLETAGVYREALLGADAPRAGIVFYRSLIEGGQTKPIDDLVEALASRGVGAIALFVASLRDEESAQTIAKVFSSNPPDVILNATAFAVSSTGQSGEGPFSEFDCPVLQVIFAGSGEQAWRNSAQGLGPRDLAMNVALPEFDGRIITRAISFKTEPQHHAPTDSRVVTYKSVPDRVEFVADLATNWIKLRKTAPANRRVGIVLANYPNKDGRIANGVGYDTPASTIAILSALSGAGYATGDFPHDGSALIETLQRGPTNASSKRAASSKLPASRYREISAALPAALQAAVTARWGAIETDPFFRGDAFELPCVTFGNIAVAIQPARGYNIDPKSSYHDPALVPPHGYFAFYFWLRHLFGAHAVIHNGKHGNLEWLPGKATALSAECYPDAILGPLPQLYPFIVNDPGEGTQAKRRTAAVIIDHLTPPLTRAETYGPLKDLEALLDEYYLAQGLDRRRALALKSDILELTRTQRLDLDVALTGDDESDLQTLDAFLCELKEAQIRDGLHVLGTSPTGAQETDLMVALTRVPRHLGEGGDASLIRAIAADLGLGDFDPLDCEMAASWKGSRPAALEKMSDVLWRTAGDTVERIELLAADLVSGRSEGGALGERTQLVLDEIASRIAPMLRKSGANETDAVLKGLAGNFVAPGPSGAPTRGRVDVLPTGRNFYSLDNRTVPTPAAWRLGEASARALLDRHFQDQGSYPTSLGLSAWGTSNMRTGGDDIAQALALIGAKPVWEKASWRVTGYEIVPLAKLGRPRVDVTLRISGFFRDAFPVQIELLDRAIRAIGTLEEDDADNPIASRMRKEAQSLVEAGLSPAEAKWNAGSRIFGSKPGSYGAGLQTLIDEKLWSERGDLARAYVVWGAYAYGAHEAGRSDERAFSERLKTVEAVIHNQDNREHDLLDSDDYYQFEGGMTAAVEEASGKRPLVYHNDHSRPERPVIRTLEDEISRVMRSRVVNPKWIAGVKRHGYKGAFEIAATVDYMFAFAATTGAVKTHHFDLAYDAFLGDEETRSFIAGNNPAALREIAERFEEAASRGLWTPRSNSAHVHLRVLQESAP